MQILHVAPSPDQSCGGIGRDVSALMVELVKGGDQCQICDEPSQIGGLARSCELLHLHGLWSPLTRAAAKTARSLKKPYVISTHGMMHPGEWAAGRWRKLPAGVMYQHGDLRRAACLHAFSEAEAGHIGTLGFNASIRTIPLGVNVAEFQEPPSPQPLMEKFPELEGTRWVLILGRIDQQKGIVPAMQACFDVLGKADGWHLIVAGPDESRIQPMLQAAIGRKGLGKRVTFTGLLSPGEARAALGRASLLLQSSITEGPCMSIIEALAAGKPVIISDACDMPEVAKIGAGRSVPPIRIAIASMLREVVAMSEAALQEMGRKARDLALERHDWSKVIPQYREMYAAAAASA
jgi:glycosyltransferase involved in cell wall biosynthesis